MRQLRALLPSADRLASVRGLRWLKPLAAKRELWRLDRRRVALGLSVGAFFGVMVPVAQILVATAVAFALRANLPAAALGTFVSNPLTIAPLYAAAYAAGAAVLGLPLELPAMDLAAVGRPLLVGAALLALALAATAWLTVEALWRLAALRRAMRWSSIRGSKGEAS
ncbi:MAG TPA: DUF2062 domain-containing protein [Burkholderiales bacterium]